MIRPISYVALLAICLAGIQRTEASKFSWFSSSKDIRLDFEAINRYLIENVDDKDPELNLNQANKWLQQKRSKGEKDSIVETLENLVALKKIASDPKCDHEEFTLLNAINIGTDKRALANENEPLRRVDRVLRYYAKAHAEICLELYPEMLASRKAHLKEGVADHVDKLKEHNRLVRSSQNEYTDADLSIEGRRLTEFSAYNFLVQEFASDPDAKYLEKIEGDNGVRVADEAKIIEFFNKHIYEPCKDFYEKVGEGLWEALDFDINVSFATGIDSAKRAKVIGDNIGLDICRRFVQYDNFRDMKINQLLNRVF